MPTLACLVNVQAQPGIAEMNQASGQLRGSFFSARNAPMVLAGLLGICGALNIITKCKWAKKSSPP